MKQVLLLVLCLGRSLAGGISAEVPVWTTDCQTPRTLNQALDRLMEDDKIELSDGVSFVKVNGTESERGRYAQDSVFSRVRRFFADHELQLKLSDIMRRKQDVVDTVRRGLTALNELQREEPEESSRGQTAGGFGGGKKGGNAVLMMATMMGGTMAALGFGALAMLVMKALTVSAMAFLLSAVLGLRRLLRRPDDDFGRISYIPVHTEHRRKRSFQDLPYRAHAKLR